MVVGYATRRVQNFNLLVLALLMAAPEYKTKDTPIHSDMGLDSKSEKYRNALKQPSLVRAMVNAGISITNQIIESYFGQT
jgi:hypothetical protein